MKKYVIFALLSSSSLMGAQEQPIYSVSSAQFFENQLKTDPHKRSVDKIIAVHDAQKKGQSEVMIINPESRAKDLQSAFKYLREMSPATKIGVKLNNGSIITQILSMDVMPGGTMIIFKINTMKGEQYRVVKIENIDTLTHA